MGTLALATLSEGMILKSDVHDRNGRLLLGCGTELDARHLRMFRMWGITEASIVGADDRAGGPVPVSDVDPARLAAAEKELLALFRNADLSCPAMGELFRLCLIRKVRNESR